MMKRKFLNNNEEIQFVIENGWDRDELCEGCYLIHRNTGGLTMGPNLDEALADWERCCQEEPGSFDDLEIQEYRPGNSYTTEDVVFVDLIEA